MSTPTFLVERPDGTRLRRPVSEVLADDLVIPDGPGEFDELDRAQRALDAEIDDAGGFERWKALQG